MLCCAALFADAARALLSRVVHMMHEEYAAGYACRWEERVLLQRSTRPANKQHIFAQSFWCTRRLPTVKQCLRLPVPHAARCMCGCALRHPHPHPNSTYAASATCLSVCLCCLAAQGPCYGTCRVLVRVGCAQVTGRRILAGGNQQEPCGQPAKGWCVPRPGRARLIDSNTTASTRSANYAGETVLLAASAWPAQGVIILQSAGLSRVCPCRLCTVPAGTLSSDDLRTMLSDKQLRHSLLLLALQVGGVLRQLPAGVLAALFEHAQMLAAAVEVLRWQRDCEAAAQGNDAAQPGNGCCCVDACGA